MTSDLKREEVEDFLYLEARLLDEWRLEDWEKLFTDDGRYLVPPVGIGDADTADPANMLFLVADDRTRIQNHFDIHGVVPSNDGTRTPRSSPTTRNPGGRRRVE